MAAGAFSWQSELPSGRSPFWIRDDGLADLGLRAGDAVSVDTRLEPRVGDLVVAEVEVDGDAARLARRYAAAGDRVRLEPAAAGFEALELPAESLLVLGVIRARVRIEDEGARLVEEPI